MPQRMTKDLTCFRFALFKLPKARMFAELSVSVGEKCIEKKS